MLTVVGVEPKRERVSSGVSFYDGRHVTPRGCCCSVKQDHHAKYAFFVLFLTTCL